jgi:levanbiose-producing levanase
VGYDFETGKAFVVRDGDVVAAASDRAAGTAARTAADEYRQARSVDATTGGSTVNLTVYVDRSSLEVFVDGGRQTLTSLVFPPGGKKEARLAAEGGPVSLKGATITPLATIR